MGEVIITKIPGTLIVTGAPAEDDPLWEDPVLREDWLHKHDEPEPEPVDWE